MSLPLSTSHSMAVRSSLSVTSRVPEALKPAASSLPCSPLSTASSSPVARSMMQTPPFGVCIAIRRPSGLTASDSTVTVDRPTTFPGRR